MIQDNGRQWTVTTIAMGILVFASMLEEPQALAVAGIAVLAAGLVLLPRTQFGWPLAALVAGSLAAIGSGLFGWDLLG